MIRHTGIQKTFIRRRGRTVKQYHIQIWHDGLNKTQIIKSDNKEILRQKANLKIKTWNEMWDRKVISENKRKQREIEAQQRKLQAEAKRQERELQAQQRKEIAEAKRIERELKTEKKEEKKRLIENNKLIAEKKTEKALNLLDSMNNILNHTLSIDDTIDWELLKDKDKFSEVRPTKPTVPEKPDYYSIPSEPEKPYDFELPPKPEKPVDPGYDLPGKIPQEPDINNPKYKPKFGLFDFSKNKKKKKEEALNLYENDRKEWERITQMYNESWIYKNKLNKYMDWKRKKEIIDLYKVEKEEWRKKKEKIIKSNEFKEKKYQELLVNQEKSYLNEIKAWEDRKNAQLKNQKDLNNAIDLKKEKYFECEPNAIYDYCEMVLSNSEYYEKFPKDFEIDYNPNNRILTVDYQLPSLSHIPTLKEVKYIQTRDEFTEKHLTKNQLNKLYDTILYQVTLRSIHELFEADKANALDAVVFNGFVNSIDPATGHEANSCVLSVQANKEEFEHINLANIKPNACFKKLKGIGSTKLHTLTPIPPIVRLDREDSRFTESYAVADGIDEGYNLAAMDWEDFEHLIREVFEKAFAETGGEVKVTQASRDGGIDAVIFDPDPLRGGKIVIQAKRYTNVVGVSAVRDLYGTVLNEGANKGILVTTSDYGSDAYNFANGKPIQLLNGNNLLHLLEQHGHKARIDIKEARKELYGKE